MIVAIDFDVLADHPETWRKVIRSLLTSGSLVACYDVGGSGRQRYLEKKLIEWELERVNIVLHDGNIAEALSDAGMDPDVWMKGGWG